MVATAPMTAAMRRLHRLLARKDRYPLPPREITSSVVPELPQPWARDTAMAAHFAYGALCGAALAVPARKPSLAFGIAGGIGIWLGSYMGWIPAFRILKPATRHPAPRNALMILSHAVWGSAYALVHAEIIESQAIMAGGPLKDVEKSPRKRSSTSPS
ncbi:MAG: hypothetical protein ACJ8FH_01770 [Sphingomicrobium sp.]